jgi:acetylornithine/LysW-gamma-L-lysine aminotransferase
MNEEDVYSSGIYPKRPVEIVIGKGAVVWDSQGREYIDCVAGIAVANTGHCNEYVNRAVRRQLDKIIVNPGIFYSDARARLMKRLADITPKRLSRVFLSNSGAESIECAVKISRAFTKRTDIIAMKKSFHGRTFGALSATWNPKYRKPFEPLVPGFRFAKFNDLGSVEALVTEKTAAIMLEPVQGESGIFPAEEGFLKGLRRICNDNDILLVFDEVQTGFGRTGKMFAFEHFGVTPDILCCAKGIAGGIPMGATIARPEIFQSLKGGEHGSTLGGNPLSCAAALANIDFILKENLPERSKRLGDYFLDRLKTLNKKSVREIRGIGLMLGIEMRFPAMQYVLKAIEKGVLLHVSGLNVIRIIPPLVITKEQIDKVVNVLGEIL